MSVIDTAFEKLDIDEANSDSEDEGETPYKTDPILEPKVSDKTLQICTVDATYNGLARMRSYLQLVTRKHSSKMRTTRFGDQHQMPAGRMYIPGGELAYPTPSHGRDIGSDIPTPVPPLGQIDTSENITLTQECIPVGCVPATALTVCCSLLPGGV